MIDQYKSVSEQFLKKGFWLYFFGFITAPIGYTIKIIVSGDLSVNEVGILYGIISLLTLVSAYNDFGMTESLKHFIPEYITKNKYDKVKTILFYSFGIQIISSLIISLFFFFGADFISESYFKSDLAKESLKIFSFFFIGINILHLFSTFFLSIQNTFYSKIIDFVRNLFLLFSILFIFFSDKGNLISYSYSWIIGLYIGILVALFIFYIRYYKIYFKKEKIIFSKKLFLKIFYYALLVVIGASAGNILSQMDMQMIIYILGTQDAGYYTNYLSIIGIPFVIITPIFALLFPVFSELYSKKDHPKIKLIKEILVNNFLIIGIAFNFLFFIFSDQLAYILFGEKFIYSGTILKYSVLFLVFNFLIQINFSLIAGIGQVSKRVKIIFIAILFNFFSNIILINLLGSPGAALTTGMGWILIYFLSEYYLGKKYKIKFDFFSIFKNILILSFLGLFYYEFILGLFENVTRIKGLILFCLFSFLWFLAFSLINKDKLKIFILEIKKLKKS